MILSSSSSLCISEIVIQFYISIREASEINLRILCTSGAEYYRAGLLAYSRLQVAIENLESNVVNFP